MLLGAMKSSGSRGGAEDRDEREKCQGPQSCLVTPREKEKCFVSHECSLSNSKSSCSKLARYKEQRQREGLFVRSNTHASIRQVWGRVS